MARLAAVLAVVMALGVVTATALARHGADDGTTTGTTGTTGTTVTTPTTTTPTTTTPSRPRSPRATIHIEGTVTARDETAGTFRLRGHRSGNGHDGSRGRSSRRGDDDVIRTWTVHANRIPRVGKQVEVTGRKLSDGSIQASKVELRDRNGNARGGDDRGRGRHHAEPGDDHGGRGGRGGESGDDSGGHGGGGNSGRG